MPSISDKLLSLYSKFPEESKKDIQRFINSTILNSISYSAGILELTLLTPPEALNEGLNLCQERFSKQIEEMLEKEIFRVYKNSQNQKDNNIIERINKLSDSLEGLFKKRQSDEDIMREIIHSLKEVVLKDTQEISRSRSNSYNTESSQNSSLIDKSLDDSSHDVYSSESHEYEKSNTLQVLQSLVREDDLKKLQERKFHEMDEINLQLSRLQLDANRLKREYWKKLWWKLSPINKKIRVFIPFDEILDYKTLNTDPSLKSHLNCIELLEDSNILAGDRDGGIFLLDKITMKAELIISNMEVTTS